MQTSENQRQPKTPLASKVVDKQGELVDKFNKAPLSTGNSPEIHRLIHSEADILEWWYWRGWARRRAGGAYASCPIKDGAASPFGRQCLARWRQGWRDAGAARSAGPPRSAPRSAVELPQLSG